MMPSNSSVQVWIQRLREGDSDLPAEKLWEHYFHRLVVLARSLLGTYPRRAADEEDVALSAFNSFCLGVQRGRFPRLDDRDNLWRLLVTISARKVYRLKLREGCQKRSGNKRQLDEAEVNALAHAEETSIGLDLFIASDPTPEFAAETAEEYRRLFGLLPKEDLRSVALWKMEGYTNEEIAARLGCAVRSVERRLQTIRICWEGGADA